MSSDKAGTKMDVVLKDRDDLKTIQNTFNSLSTRHQNELKNAYGSSPYDIDRTFLIGFWSGAPGSTKR